MSETSNAKAPLLSKQLCFALYATSRAFTKVYASLLEEMGITYPQYLVLLVLWEKDGVPVQYIADQLEIEAATATPMIKRMENLDLLVRQRSTKDERQVLIHLSEKGEAYRQKAVDIPDQLGCRVNVSNAQAMKLLKELNAIRANIG